MKLKFALSFFLFSLIFSIQAQDGPQVEKISDHVYMLKNKGGNIGIYVGENETLMIDDQFENVAEENLAAIKKISDKPIKYLINTHHHGDHSGGNAFMAEQGAVLISHSNVRKRILDNSKNGKAALPVLTFDQSMKIHFDDEAIYAFHVDKAHTDGDVIIYFPNENVIHMGDVFFNGRYPYIDDKSGGNINGYIRALKEVSILGNKDTKVIPGHGDLGTVEDVKATAKMLSTITSRIKEAIKEGKTEDEIASDSEITKEFDAKGYGDFFINSETIRRTIFKQLNMKTKSARGIIKPAMKVKIDTKGN